MVDPYEANMNGARLARNIAAECLHDAQTADPARASHLIAEHDRHIERAEFYEGHASLMAPKITQGIAA